MLTRRQFLGAAGCGALAVALPGCGLDEWRDRLRAGGSDAVLTARPGTGEAEPMGPGTHPLLLAGSHEFLVHVPPTAVAPTPLVVSLHGAGGDAQGGLSLLAASADAHGFALLAPASRGSTWDAIRGRYGEDVAAIDEALRRVFGGVEVDPGRVVVAGFSDGASYALGLGLANGGLFRHVVAFSPGFVPAAARAGRPAVFVSHGVHDDVLPVASTSRRIVPALEEDGYDVTYREFDGGHEIPPDVVAEAVAWLGWDAWA
ncbi:alpha/beta hydrolase [Georgenia sp. AZ-5]|uniref:alpha/beta hydrolase n=1 Tax=Georgenia sp. AZ-5 TaxID=3367526 RepID=UPI003754530D